MTLNYIWVGSLAFIVAIIKTFAGNPEIFSLIVNSIFERAELGFKLFARVNWNNGFMVGNYESGEKGGTIDILSKLFTTICKTIS